MLYGKCQLNNQMWAKTMSVVAGQNSILARVFSRAALPDAKAQAIFWPIVVFGVVADLWSKSAVFNWLAHTPSREHSVIDGFFNLMMGVNDGAAFNFASGQRVGLVSISIAGMIIVSGVFLFGRIKTRLMQVALGLFTAGVIGNLYDRAFNGGQVRDFLDFFVGGHHFPAFNVADSLLCAAVVLIVISNFFVKQVCYNKVNS
jgi:signal peptidase II